MSIFKEIFMKEKNSLARLKLLSLLGLSVMVLSLHDGCSPQKDKSPNNEQVESVPEENTEDVDYTFTLHKTDYKKIVWYSEGLDSEMMSDIILRDSIVEKILEVKPPIIKIELFDGGYGIVECDGIASAKLITGAIYSHYIDDEGVVGFKPVMVYRWVGGKPLK